MEDKISAIELELGEINATLLQLAWKIDDVEKKSPNQTLEIFQVQTNDLRGKLVSVENELSLLRTRIDVLNKVISSYQEPEITLPDTNIISHRLWNRMWAVFGHGLLGNIILTTWIIAIVILIFRGN